MTEVVDASVPYLGIQIGTGGFGFQFAEVLPSFFEHIVHDVLAYLLIRDETESIVIQAGIVFLV